MELEQKEQISTNPKNRGPQNNCNQKKVTQCTFKEIKNSIKITNNVTKRLHNVQET